MYSRACLILPIIVCNVVLVFAQSQIVLEGPERWQCAEITKLEGILAFIDDTAQLDAYESRHNLTQDEIDDIKASSTRENATLQALQANSTLLRICAASRAEKELKADCREMRRCV
jgi:hypothetical protein